VWDSPDSRALRVLVDVVESNSAAEAVEVLVERLEWNQLARVAERPSGLGDVAFVHPDGVPPAVFFTRGNLSVTVVSFGHEPLSVQPWAERFDRRLLERPAVERPTIALSSDRPTARAGTTLVLDYTIPWKFGDDGYLKFFAAGGVLVRREGRLTFTPTRSGEALVEVYQVEPGREPYVGRLVLDVK
jgi:hypothetical protein